jgi:hypothetical protein
MTPIFKRAAEEEFKIEKTLFLDVNKGILAIATPCFIKVLRDAIKFLFV